MKSSMKSSMAALFAVLAAGSIEAEMWIPSGAKGVGMGGAGVACPEGSQAMLVNPAALGKKEMDRFDLALPVTVMAGAEGELVETADRLRKNYDTNVGPALTSIRTANKTSADYASATADVINFLTDTVNGAAALNKEGQGIHADVSGHLTARWARLGISAGTRILGGATVVYDGSFAKAFSDINGGSVLSSDVRTRIAGAGTTSATATQVWTDAGSSAAFSAAQIQTLIDQLQSKTGTPVNAGQQTLLTSIVKSVNATSGSAAGSTGSSAAINNNTGLKIKLIQTRELAAGYAFRFEKAEKLIVAPSLKVIKGETTASYIRLLDSQGKDKDVGDQLTDDSNAKSGTQITMDLGMLYLLNERWTLGLMGKDLTNPSFETSIGEDVELERNVRIGTAYQYMMVPGWRGILAADLDALKNESSIVKGAERQEFALGVSQELMGWLSLRAGLSSNFGGTNDSTSYSAGLGFQFFRFYLDVSGMKSNDEVTVDGDDYPTAGGLGVTIGWNQNF